MAADIEDVAGQVEAVSKATLAVEDAQTKYPDAPEVTDNLVKLPGGLIKGDKVITTAIVQELTGEHEEKLARASQSRNQFHFLRTLLECGTVQIGEEDPKDTVRLLKDLLVGDRDQLLLGIRSVTYGQEVTVERWVCPSCSRATDVTLDLTEDVPKVGLKNRTDRTFEVKLRRGRVAVCNLLTGHDQEVVTADGDFTTAERNTIILTKCVEHIEDPNGTRNSMVAWPSLAKQLGVADRRTILKELVKRSPGPRYNDIRITHEECGEEVTLALAIGDLFPL